MQYLAKQSPNVTLSDHTKMVINLSIAVAKDRIKNPDESILKKIAIAAALHDLGKCSKTFQSRLNTLDEEGLETDEQEGKKKVATIDFHNAVSWAFAYSCIGNMDSEKRYRSLRSAILYHHTLKGDTDATSEDIIERMMDDDPDGFKAMKTHYLEAVKYIDDTFGFGISDDPDFALRDIDDPDDLKSGAMKDEKVYPKIKDVFKDYKTDEMETKKRLRKHQESCWEMGIVRAIVVYADRAISSKKYDNEKILANDAEYLSGVYEEHLKTHYTKEPDYTVYDQTRLSSQKDVVDEISAGEEGLYDISASAGFGKTLIGLMHHFKEGRKTMWVVPRIIIADGVYHSIVSEVKKMGMEDEVKVALMYGGKFEKGDESCDIIVSVIDTFLGRYTRNNLSTFLIDSYFGDIIFDEYHEFICKEPLFSAFVNTVYGRRHHTDTKTLLLSATGFSDTLASLIGGSVNLIKPEIYGGDTEVEIHVKNQSSIDKVPMDPDENSFTIMPTVSSAQDMYRRTKERERMLIHARYTDEDRANHEENLYRMYGKGRTDAQKPVIGTSIIGTGLDVSARSITHYMPTPDATIQIGCGRASRFKEHSRVVYTVIACSDAKKFLGSLYDTELRNKWVDVLRTLDGKVVTKSELYRLRDEFYQKNRKKFTEFVMFKYQKSSEGLSEISYRNGGIEKGVDYDMVTNKTSYRGAPTSFYVIAPLEDKDGEYTKPMVCDTDVILNSENNNDDSKARYNYMLESPNFPSQQELKYGGYKIRKWSDATKERCASLAYRSDRPMLLLNHKYSEQLGLYSLGDDEE